MAHQIVGGTSQPKQPDEEVQKICDQVKPDAEARAGRQFSTFQALSYVTQVVTGINYFIKVDVGEEDVVHVRVFKKASCFGGDMVLELTDMQQSKNRNAPLAYF